jgi:hypothetical protein
MVIKDDIWLKILPCLNSYRCLSRMINHLELGKLKFKIKDLLFVAFQLKILPTTIEALISLVTWLSIP